MTHLSTTILFAASIILQFHSSVTNDIYPPPKHSTKAAAKAHFAHDQSLSTTLGIDLPITRIDGVGIGGNFVDIDDATLQRILNASFNGEIGYLAGRGPIQAKIFNPQNIVEGEYEITFLDENLTNDVLDSEVRWQLKRLNSNDPPILSNQTIDVLNEQFFDQYGFSVTIGQTLDAGNCDDPTAGAVGIESVYGDASGQQWFNAVTEAYNTTAPSPFSEIFNFLPESFGNGCNYLSLAQMGSGQFVPYQLCRHSNPNDQLIISPAWRSALNELVIDHANYLKELNNVDIIFTPDKSLWSRCIVVETMSPYYPSFATNQAGSAVSSLGSTLDDHILSFDLRKSPSVGKDDTNGDGLPEPDGDDIGMGWFPGYAIDVETGKRLNIFFGENSVFSHPNGFVGNYPNGLPNGGDMLYNPNDKLLLDGPTDDNLMRYYAGGQHFIYVTNEEYDQCEYLRSRLHPDENNLKKVNALKRVTWTSMSFLQPGTSLLPLSQGLIPNEYRVKLRVDNPYQVAVGTGEFNGYPTYRFTVSDMTSATYEKVEQNAAMSKISVVPNPCFRPTSYGNNSGSSTVKIINLPAKCTVTVYTVNGSVVRIFERDELPNIPNANPIQQSQVFPDLEWNINDINSQQLDTGVYFIQVKAPGIGERTLKLVII